MLMLSQASTARCVALQVVSQNTFSARSTLEAEADLLEANQQGPSGLRNPSTAYTRTGQRL